MIDVPALDIDKRYPHLRPEQVLERRIVAHLCAHLAASGWRPTKVAGGDDGDEKCTDAKSAMELVFNLDDCWLFFAKPRARTHWVRLVLGNGEDLVSDWSYSAAKPHVHLPEDWDRFGAAMDAFKVEEAF